jgi:uncharacterized membrane protein
VTNVPQTIISLADHPAAIRPAPSQRPERLTHIDAFRGFIMAVMALDHVRSFFHTQAIVFDPTDLTQATPGLFLTRWITHLCAPAFVLLAGAAAYLSTRRGRSVDALARYLRHRGLWLIVVEFTLVKVGWSFNLDYSHVIGQVIWAIGWGMIVLSFALRLPPETVMKLGMTGLALHGLFVLIPSHAMGSAWPFWNALFTGEHIRLPGFDFASKYPVLPWTALMAVGYGIGPVLTGDRAHRRAALVRSGLLSLAGFAALRWVEMGGHRPSEAGASTFLWFMDVEKYPPSLTFFLATIGLTLLLLAAFDRAGRQPGPLVVFGRVPFFFYVLHIPFIHALAMIAEIASRPVHPALPAENWRFTLPFVYAVWCCVLVMMYPFCRWFADLKKRRSDPWLSYL